ncbi:hypothetical protein VA596_50035 [Amycolatopsis sp., V23-08]|uniref:Glyoxalase-like domain-containing protein n=1 Tax=Amycolatopsis heterodermiae TaxID=3110235 RepID=A0ABU5RN51_9PSEU|nr:hypothetical protein [Amycolatopsis sp., V23-08]MEA5367752.1 hypothetical protein [Amycolatopsis sp., V23-08]
MTTSGLTTRTDQLDMLGEIADASAAALAALLAHAGFERDGQLINHPQSGVTVAVPTDCAGYRITFPQASARNGLGIVDLPVAATYGVVQHVALALHAQDGAENFPPAAAPASKFGDSLRQLADTADRQPELGDWFGRVTFRVHRAPGTTSSLDDFAELFGTTVEPVGDTGRYVEARADVGGIALILQADKPAYAREHGAVPDAELGALHVMRDTCWCLPIRGECGQVTHHNEDGSEPQFVATDTDPITRDGYATEDHR